MERIGGRRKPVARHVVFAAGLMALTGAVPARRSVKLAGASFALVLSLMSALWLAPFAGAIPPVCPGDSPACQEDIPGVPDNPDQGGPGDLGDIVEDPTEEPEDPTEEPEDPDTSLPGPPLPEDPTEPLDPITDPVDETTDPITDPVDETTDPITDPVDETTDPVTDPVDETTDPVTDPVDEPTDPVTEDDSGWVIPDTDRLRGPDLPVLEDPPEPIGGGLKDVRKPIEKIDTTEGLTGPFDSRTKKFERAQPVAGTEQPKDDRERTGDKAPSGGDAKSPAIAGFSEARSSSGSGAPATHRRGLDADLAADSEGINPSLFDRVGDVSVEVAKNLAFPLALLLLVTGFLLIHNRIDRKDPKLAHAPVRADNDSLNFE
jgi:hypothetical protein